MGRNIDNHYIQIKLNEAVSLAEQIQKIINDDTVQSFVLENTDEAVSEALRWLKKDLDQINYSTAYRQSVLNQSNNTDAVQNELEDSDHFGEEQAEGLDNLLEGLKDTPHDNRW